MRYAWAENNVIRDVCYGNPSECYTSDIAAHYTTIVPDDIRSGATFDGTKWSNPTPHVPTPAEPVKRYRTMLTPLEFKMLFTATERVAIKAAAANDPLIADYLEIADDPRLKDVDLSLQANIDGIGYMVSKGLLAASRGATILLGIEE